MTTITLINDGVLDILRVNGRMASCNPRITSIRKVNAGRWEGEAGGEPFEIIGGKASGGASNEWATRWVHLAGDKFIWVKSAKAAVDLIENC